MMKILTPIIMLIASIGLFFMYVSPTYKAAADVRAQIGEYDLAIARAKQVVSKRDDLLVKRNSFSPEDINRLQKFLPDSIDPVRFIIDISYLTGSTGSQLTDIKVVDEVPKPGTTVGQNTPVLGSMLMSFGVTMSYDQFQQYLVMLEHSLQLVDVSVISFKPVDTSNNYSYVVNLRAYYLK